LSLPPDVESIVVNGLGAMAVIINKLWPDDGLHRRGVPSTKNSWWMALKSTNGWVLTSGRRYGQWVQPQGIAGKAHDNPPHGFEVSRKTIPKMVSEFVIQLQASTGRNVRVKRHHPLGRRIEFRMDPNDPEAILVELYKNGVDR